jgi:hypothetical protein
MDQKLGIVCALILLFAGTATADLSVVSVAVSPSSVVSGGTGVVTLTLANPGPYKIRDVTVSVEAGPRISFNGQSYLGEIQVDGQLVTSIPFQVKSDTPTGLYSAKLSITGFYEDPSQGYDDKYTLRNIELPITVASTAVFNLGYEVPTVKKKSPFAVTTTIRNFGDAATNAYVSVSSTNFIPIGEYPKFLGTIGNETNVTFELALNSDTFNGRDTINVILNYTDRLGVERRASLPLSVYVKRSPEFVVGSVVSSPLKLVQGTDEATLKIELQNIGEAKAENINANIILPLELSPSYSYSDRFSLGTIAQGASKTATYYVDVKKGVRGGTYNATLQVNYTSESESEAVSLPVEIRITETPEFEITTVSTEPKAPVPGDKVSLRVTVKNVGGKDADSVSFRAFSEQEQPFDYEEKSDFIGKLKQGEEATAVLVFTVANDTHPKNYILSTEVRAVSDGNVIVSDDSVRVSVGEGKSGLDQNGMLVPAAVAILALGIGAYAGMYLERRKKAR